MSLPAPVIARMESRVLEWEASADERALFLRCYAMMSGNTLAAIGRREFDDPEWVDRLLHRFADYYFDALEAYEQDPASAPAVWRGAHDLARDRSVWPLQKLLLGINAHINYDLVLALCDVLRPEWGGLTEHGRASRYADHCRINDVIGRTVDAVQDQVVGPATPAMGWIDRLLGPLDEALVSGLIARWREDVWGNAARLLSTADPGEQALLVEAVAEGALRTSRAICWRPTSPQEPAPPPLTECTGAGKDR